MRMRRSRGKGYEGGREREGPRSGERKGLERRGMEGEGEKPSKGL